jgi:hypothetical protein
VFDFELSNENMATITRLDTGRRGGPEPDEITLEAFGQEIPTPGTARWPGCVNARVSPSTIDV